MADREQTRRDAQAILGRAKQKAREALAAYEQEPGVPS